MEANQTSPLRSTRDDQPPAEDENADAPPHQNMQTTAIVNPFINPLMIPHIYYWPYSQPMGFPFAQFPFGPPFQVVCPCHTAACYLLQQSMMGMPAYPIHFPPMPLNSIRSSVTPIAQSTSTGPGPVTSITNNFVAFNEIGNDNSTNGYSSQVTAAVQDNIPEGLRRKSGSFFLAVQ